MLSDVRLPLRNCRPRPVMLTDAETGSREILLLRCFIGHVQTADQRLIAGMEESRGSVVTDTELSEPSPTGIHFVDNRGK